MRRMKYALIGLLGVVLLFAQSGFNLIGNLWPLKKGFAAQQPGLADGPRLEPRTIFPIQGGRP
jgi:hypothetical protein